MWKKTNLLLKKMLIYYFIFAFIWFFTFIIIEHNNKESLPYFIFILIFFFFLPYNIKYIKYLFKNNNNILVKDKYKYFSKFKSIDKKKISLLKNKNFRNNQNYNLWKFNLKKLTYYHNSIWYSRKKLLEVDLDYIKKFRINNFFNIIKNLTLLVIIILIWFIVPYFFIITIIFLFYIIWILYDLIFSLFKINKNLFIINNKNTYLIFII